METAIQYLPGVGPKRAALLEQELGIATVGDLVHLYPFRYIDRSSIVRIADVQPDLAQVQVRATVQKVRLFAKNGAELPADKLKYNAVSRLSVLVADDSGEMEMVFFKGVKWMHSRLVPGATFIFFGKPAVFNNRRYYQGTDTHPRRGDGYEDTDIRSYGGRLPRRPFCAYLRAVER